MTQFFTFRSLMLAVAAGAILVGGYAVAERSGAFDADLTLEAMQTKALERFDQADANGDGILTQEEFDAAHTDRSSARLARMFERADANDDGLISADERGYDRLSERLGLSGDISLEMVQAAMAERHEGAGQTVELPMTRDQALSNAAEKFAELDANSDGVLDASERPERRGRGHR